MGFFNKLRKKVRGQIAPVMPMPPRKTMENAPPAMDLDRIMRGPGLNPRDPALEGLKIIDYIPGRRPKKPQTFEELLANAPSIKKVEKRGGLAAIIRRLQEQLRNQQMPQPIPERMPVSNVPSFNPTIFGQPIRRDMDFSQMPQISPEDMRNLQVPTQMPVMPEERMAPPVMNQMQGEPRMMMAVGGPLMGRAANLSRQVLNKNRMERNLPGRATSNIGDMVMSGRAASPLTDSLRRGTEDFIIGATAGGTLGAAAIGLDGTQTLREPFSINNVSFMSPEAFGRDLAQLRMDVGSVVNLAKNKANEVGANINEYVERTRSAYDQQMENQRMQELDSEQGMQPFSMLMGPDMPLFRPKETDPRVERMIEAGMNPTPTIDDILSDLEKKN